MRHDGGRRFADATDHRQRARQLAVPGLERMCTGAAVFVAKTIVAALHHMHEPAWRTRVRIVVDGEDAAIRYNTDAERIPKTDRNSPEPAAVRCALKNRARTILSRERLAVWAD